VAARPVPSEMTLLTLSGGIALLLLGAEGLVRGGVALARRLGVSPLLIGLVLVGFGTSTPELVASLRAALAGSPGIAVGNVVGSNIANVLLILGVSAVIRPLACEPRALSRDGVMLAFASLLGAGVMLAGTLERLVGAALVLILAGYIVQTYRRERVAPDASAEMHAQEATAGEPGPKSLGWALALAVGGLAATVVGADLLVDGGLALARAQGIPETVIGLTLVAVGTSLPELATSAVAALRGQSDVALGNILGSNIYNILGILGLTAVVRPIAVPAEILHLDIWVMLAAVALLLVFARTGRRLSRGEGAVLLGLYGLYLAVLADVF